jgi:hypothetical protein
MALSIVPRFPPDSTAKAVWDAILAPQNVLLDPPSYTGRIVRDALWVRFDPDAPQAARAAAIASVSGQVVGGRPLVGTDGYYLVKIPFTLVHGDSISGPLLRASERLKHTSSVRSVLLLDLGKDF